MVCVCVCAKSDIIQTWLEVDAETNVMWGIALVVVVVVVVVVLVMMMVVARDRNYGRLLMLLGLPFVLEWMMERIDC